jgi:hypothetical protein
VRALNAVYPEDKYIAQIGQGASLEAARAAAVAEISRYFSQEVETSIASYESLMERGGALTTRSLDSETFIRSQTELFAVRYGESWLNQRENQWETAAYIDRDEAWAVFEPRFRREAEAFEALYEAAENEVEPFKKVLRFYAADNYRYSREFENTSFFGQILSPDRMNTGFAETRTHIAAIPQKLDNAKRKAIVYINCPSDFENILNNAFASKFTALGFPVTKTKAEAAAVCVVTVDEGRQERELGIFYSPSLQAVISGNSGTLFAYSAKAARASAVTPDVAKRRAYATLAEEINKGFTIEPVR